ncbi:YihY/virulence factor BrkB family protein [Salaquimonas pukyongi]|uniref:YihY/virulence factor BrkB family protein n=1 Tax=Salaquimonas pukyongi TaxID=2712698 RepID=UPI00096BB550|nr:YihY/virulence factor BrkB family protein [Salaquimonas pukyongi]
MYKELLHWWHVLRDAYDKFNRDDGWAIASHVALSSLFALFPFLIFATSIAAFFELGGFTENVIHLIFDYWPPAAREAIAGEIRTILTVPRTDIITIGGLLTLYFASNGVEALRVALNRSYREKDERPFWYLRLQSFGFVFLSIVVLMVITLFFVLLPLGWQIMARYIPELIPWREAVLIWRVALALAVLFLALLVSHLVLPAGHRSISSVLPGIFFTLICWLAGSLAFGMYLEQFADYVSTYAGLAGAMVGLIFLYMLGLIFIFGGEINAASLRRKRPG